MSTPKLDHDVRAEFLVEPFVEGSMGPHVEAALEACRQNGFDPEVGPFATSIEGPLVRVTSAINDITHGALQAGATAVQVRVGDTAVASGFGALHDALDRMVASVEAELGGRLVDLSREDKQAAVRLLEERGAFLLRKAVESVGDMMGVSRITIYNYLNAVERAKD